MSQQLRRENKTDEREVHVEKDKVPKTASHFESLTVKDSGDQPVVHHVTTTMHGAAGGIHDQSAGKSQYKGPSLEEISKYRGTAQQNSMDAIRAAEEQYQKKKEMAARTGGTGQVNKNNLSGGAQSGQAKGALAGVTQTASENAARASDYTVMKSQQAKDRLSSAAQKTASAKDYTLEKGQQTGQQAKESLSSAAQTAAEKAARAKDYTVEKGYSAAQIAVEKAAQAKDYTLEKSCQAKDVVAEKTTGITETAVDVSKRGASYVGEKAVAAKDVALDTGKAAAGYVGKAAGAVKDKAVVAGWTAAEFASDKAVGATETMANVASGVAGFAGNTVVATNDVVADVAKKTMDMVVSTEESAKEYAARKKAEKQRELEAKNSRGEGEWVSEEQGGGGFVVEEDGFESQGGGYGRQGGGIGTVEGGYGRQVGGGTVEGGYGSQGTGGSTGGGGGVMGVIGETLMEIGQNTKDMFVGQGGQKREGGIGESKDKFRG